MFRQKLKFPAQNVFFLPKFLQNIPPCLAVVLGDLLVGGLGALVALLTLLPLYVAILFHVNLLAALLRDVPALLPRHLHALLLVLGHALLLGNLHTVLHIFAVLLGDVFAALGVGGLALLPGHGLALLLIAGGAMLFGNILRKLKHQINNSILYNQSPCNSLDTLWSIFPWGYFDKTQHRSCDISSDIHTSAWEYSHRSGHSCRMVYISSRRWFYTPEIQNEKIKRWLVIIS